MEKGTRIPGGALQGEDPRGPQRVKILAALHGICLSMERLAQSEASREACREIARMLSEARMKEERRLAPK